MSGRPYIVIHSIEALEWVFVLSKRKTPGNNHIQKKVSSQTSFPNNYIITKGSSKASFHLQPVHYSFGTTCPLYCNVSGSFFFILSKTRCSLQIWRFLYLGKSFFPSSSPPHRSFSYLYYFPPVYNLFLDDTAKKFLLFSYQNQLVNQYKRVQITVQFDNFLNNQLNPQSELNRLLPTLEGTCFFWAGGRSPKNVSHSWATRVTTCTCTYTVTSYRVDRHVQARQQYKYVLPVATYVSIHAVLDDTP